MAQAREQWGTRLGVIMAVTGSAVGIGNFLRFPGQAVANGGGTFMIPYFCALGGLRRLRARAAHRAAVRPAGVPRPETAGDRVAPHR